MYDIYYAYTVFSLISALGKSMLNGACRLKEEDAYFKERKMVFTRISKALEFLF